MKFRGRFLICFVIAVLSITSDLSAQVAGKRNDIVYLNGYHSSIEGQRLKYHCFNPYATQSLLTRCTDGSMVIRWRTDPVVIADKNIKTLRYSWICGFSSGTSHGVRLFKVALNGKAIGEFRTRLNGNNIEWIPAAIDKGIELSFQLVYKDAVADCFGYMILEMPSSDGTEDGNVIEICGTADNSNDWFMIFERDINPRISSYVAPAIIQKDNQNFRELSLYIETPFPDVMADVYVDGVLVNTVQAGYNNPEIKSEILPHRFEIPDVSGNSDVVVQVKIGQVILSEKVKVPPVKIKKIYLLPHSHNDIGYTNVQPEILNLQKNNLAVALDLIDKTRGLPEGSRYKWNSEMNWSLEAFLNDCDSLQRVKMIQEIKDGNIGVNGLYTNPMSGIAKAEELMRIAESCRTLKDKYGFSFMSAMITDVPGMSWSMVPAMYYAGIKYLSWGPNVFDRIGWSTEMLGDKPFYWVSPSGQEKVLVWVSGRGYSFFHGYNTISEFKSFPQKLFPYLNHLDSSGYEYDMVQLRVALYSDNGPNDSTLSAYVQDWNSRYSQPKLHIATTDEMFLDFEEEYGKTLPELKGDFTPYWEDGALSTAYELGENRKYSEKTNQLETAYMILNPTLYSQSEFYKLWQSIALFTEHTWGAFNSTTEPDLPFVTEQWRYKQGFLRDAEREYKQLYAQLFQELSSKNIEIINTSEHDRTEVVIINLPDLFIDAAVYNPLGKEVESQLLSGKRLAFVAGQVPALGSSVYTIRKRKKARVSATESALKMETPEFTLEIDQETGALKSLFDKQRKYEWCGKGNINSYLYVKGLSPENAAGTTFKSAEIISAGPLVYELKVSMDAPGAVSLETVYSVYVPEKTVRVVNTLDKMAVREKEAAYFSFPFNVIDPVDRFDAGWTEYGPGLNQLKGACNDFYYAMRWADVSGDASGISLIVNEAPLLETAEITDETPHNSGISGWKAEGSNSSVLYSYILNNYWHTNFKADQSGKMTFSYALVPHDAYNRAEVYRSSIAYHQPLMIRWCAANEKASLFTVSDENIIVTSVKPSADSKGYMIRLFNASDQVVNLDINWNTLKPSGIFLSNILEDRTEPLVLPYNVLPAGILNIRVEL